MTDSIFLRVGKSKMTKKNLNEKNDKKNRKRKKLDGERWEQRANKGETSLFAFWSKLCRSIMFEIIQFFLTVKRKDHFKKAPLLI